MDKVRLEKLDYKDSINEFCNTNMGKTVTLAVTSFLILIVLLGVLAMFILRDEHVEVLLCVLVTSISYIILVSGVIAGSSIMYAAKFFKIKTDKQPKMEMFSLSNKEIYQKWEEIKKLSIVRSVRILYAIIVTVIIGVTIVFDISAAQMGTSLEHFILIELNLLYLLLAISVIFLIVRYYFIVEYEDIK